MLTRTRLETGNGWQEFSAPTVDVARLVANVCGYSVDVEPMEPGRVLVRAESASAKLTFRGTTVHDACQKLIESLSGQKETNEHA